MTHILFSSFAFLPSLAALCVSHLGAETGNIVVAFFGVPLLSALLASEAKLLVLELSLGIGAVKITLEFLAFCETSGAENMKLDIYNCNVHHTCDILPLLVLPFL